VKKTRKHYTGEEKVAILRRHLLEQVSKLCDEFGLEPTVFYRWQKEFFENPAAAFQAKARSDHQAEKDRIEFLEKKIQRKDEVLAELMSEHIALKKELGEL
jgi:transposase-like protein